MTIATKLTGFSTGNWLQDLHRIGGGGNSPRQAVRLWAAQHGAVAASWSGMLIGICFAVTGIIPISWREALRLLAESDSSFSWSRLLDSDSNRLFDADGNALYVRG